MWLMNDPHGSGDIGDAGNRIERVQDRMAHAGRGIDSSACEANGCAGRPLQWTEGIPAPVIVSRNFAASHGLGAGDRFAGSDRAGRWHQPPGAVAALVGGFGPHPATQPETRLGPRVGGVGTGLGPEMGAPAGRLGRTVSAAHVVSADAVLEGEAVAVGIDQGLGVGRGIQEPVKAERILGRARDVVDAREGPERRLVAPEAEVVQVRRARALLEQAALVAPRAGGSGGRSELLAVRVVAVGVSDRRARRGERARHVAVEVGQGPGLGRRRADGDRARDPRARAIDRGVDRLAGLGDRDDNAARAGVGVRVRGRAAGRPGPVSPEGVDRELASRVGFEPTTQGLKVPCSAAELPALGEG